VSEIRVTVCRACDGPPTNSVLGQLLIKKHGTNLVKLGVVHRPQCPNLEDKEEPREQD
jgi:hypothetical protein